MSSIKVVVFDFDNCLALDENTRKGSEEIKDRAWFEVFPEHDQETLNSILEQAKLDIVGGKGDRRDIVEYVLRHLGFLEAEIPNEIERRCNSFNLIVQEGIKQIKISPQVRESLAKLSKHFPLYVNTATPREAVLESLQALKLLIFFRSIYARPGTKVNNLRSIIKLESVKPNKLLFIDDQESGWKTAQEIGCRFVGIYTARNTLWQNNPQSFPIINSLTELVTMLGL